MAYTLKDFDFNLAATGFKCIMLTGSYATGDTMDDETMTLFPSGIVTTDTSKTSRLKVEEEKGPVKEGEYRFNIYGRCLDDGYGSYKLMLMGAEKAAPDTDSLEAINTTLETVNTTLNELKETIASYIQQTENRLEALENQ